jgi:hypothetical protein
MVGVCVITTPTLLSGFGFLPLKTWRGFFVDGKPRFFIDRVPTNKGIVMVQFLGIESENGKVDIKVLWYDQRCSFTGGNSRIFETKGENLKKDLFWMEAVLGMERIKLERKEAAEKQNN